MVTGFAPNLANSVPTDFVIGLAVKKKDAIGAIDGYDPGRF
jgi:hypothetical protein